MKYKLVLSLLLLWIMSVQAWSQGLIGVRHYSTEDGLSQNGIQDIVQDNEGYMWMATRNGLEMFDGYAFRNFKSYPTDNVRLKHNRMTELAVGKDNLLWCKTYDKQVYVFDTRQKVFKDIWESESVKRCENARTIISLDNGVVWIIGEDGTLWRCVGGISTGKRIVCIPVGTTPLHGNQISDIVLDPFGNEWILTNRGCFVYANGKLTIDSSIRNTAVVGNTFYLVTRKGDLYAYNPNEGLKGERLSDMVSDVSGIFALKDGRMAVVTDNSLAIYDVAHHNFNKLCELVDERNKVNLWTFLQDKNGNLWLQDRYGVIFRYDMASERLDAIRYKGVEVTKNKAFIHEDRYGFVWVLPPDASLMCYNNERGIFTQAYIYDNGKKRNYDKSFYGTAVLSYMFDIQKNLWHCCDRGFNKITFEDNSYKYVPAANKSEVRSLFVDSQRRLWVGNKNGNIELYDENQNYIGNLSINGNIVKGRGETFSDARMYCFFEDKQNRMWMGSREHGLFVAEPQGDRFNIKRYTHQEDNPYSLNNNSIYSIAQDSVGHIWVGTYGGGLNLVEGEFPNFRFMNCDNGLKICDRKDEYLRVRTIVCTSDGVVVTGTTDGLVCFSQDFTTPTDITSYVNHGEDGNINSLANNDVMQVMETSWGDVYVISYGGGVSRIISDTLLDSHLQFEHLNKNNGLPSDIAYALLEDNGYIWISFETCLCRYNPKTNAVETFWKYNRDLHLLNSEASMVIDSKRIMHVGTQEGLLRIDLNRIRVSDFMPPVVFNGVTIRKDNTETEIPLDEDNILTLTPDQRNVTINFAALDFTNSENLKYAYRLKEVSDEWVYVEKLHSASFVNLPAGELTLETMSTNGDGVWCNNTASLRINVKPTFWETEWAWILYVLIVLIVIILIAGIIVYILDLRRKVDFEQQLTNLKLRFFTDISHELRTPLTLITAPVEEVMQEEQLSKKGRESMYIAKQNIDRMLRLINQLLDFRKVQNDKMKLYVEQVDVVDMFRRIFENFSSLAKQRNIEFLFITDVDSKRIFTDVDKLEKILFNLLSNAFKYTPNGCSIQLIISTKAESLEFVVKDEGQGFDMDKLNLLFNRFETLGKQTTHASSGIGLSLVNEFLILIHGTIHVESHIGQGSLFRVNIPVDYSAFRNDENVEFIFTDSANADKEQETLPPIQADCDGDITLLVVEDNEELRRFLVMLFQERYHVLEACNGVEGLALIKNNQPDLVISDIMMPIMDGIELLDATRKNNEVSHIPFVLLTAKGSLDDRINGLENGADDYIIKPFSGSYLKVRVESLLKRRSALLDYYVRKYSQNTIITGECVATETDNAVPSLTEYDSAFVQQIVEKVEDKLMDTDFKIDDLVDEMNLSRSVFYRKIRTLLGVAPKDIVSEVRIKKAVALLEAGENNISEIAYKTGFTSPQYFAKVFKKAKGCTPSEFRKKK